MRRKLPVIALVSTLSYYAIAETAYELPKSITEFLNLNCYECHNDVETKGELDLESLAFDPESHANMDLWAYLYDRVRDHEMPPPEDSLVKADERTDFVEEFESLLHDVSREYIAAEGRVNSRRLNSIEYENTLHELLGVNIPLLELLPEDQATFGFINIAKSQQLSYHVLKKYLEVVDVMLDESFGRAISPPPVAREPLPMEMQPTVIDNQFGTIFHWEGKKLYHTTANKTYRHTNGEWIDLNSPLDLETTRVQNAELMDRLTYGPFKRVYGPRELGAGKERIHNERQGIYYDGYVYSFPTTHGFHGRMAGTEVPSTGWYRIKVQAKAYNPTEGRNVWGRIYTGILRAKAPATYWVGKFEATRELQEFVFDAWISKDHIIGIAPIDKTIPWVSSKRFVDLAIFEDGATGIAVKGLEIERIHPGLETSELREQLFAKLKVRAGELVSSRPEQDLHDLLGRFAERAFRRPITDYDIEPYYDFAMEELDRSGSLLRAVKAGYRAILSSHRFIFFEEKNGKLDDYSLASRLSYFLWSAPPDQILYQEAKFNRLSQPKYLKAQVERMLNDPKAEAFVKNFTDSWLELKDINFTSPDATLYPEFDNILLHSMLDETRAFLKHMVDENLSVTNVIDSDFTIVNERIAKHYDLDFGTETGMRKVALDEDDHRGGILTHASVLKVTANGTTTSPILRGVWLLERILGEHVAPPPDQVPAVEPDIRGAISIRDQLEKHRNIESCMACHQKIDPPGFALENYDVIGGWRKNYRAVNDRKKWADGPHVDASYDMPDGRSFEDVKGFKKLALERPEKIARNVVNQVITYATGAEVQFADKREIEEIIASLSQDDYGFRTLIHEVTQSDIFQSK